LTNMSHSLSTSQLFLNHVSIIFVISDVFAIPLIKLLLPPLLPLLFTLKLITATLSYSIFLLIKQIVFNLFSILLLVPSPKLLNFITSLLF
jgi:hypothetical protein